MVMFQKMGADTLQFIAVQVDQLSALLALAVEADRILASSGCTDGLDTRRRRASEGVQME